MCHKIGKAKLLLDEYKSFIGSEIEHGRKKEKSWYHTADDTISSNEISNLLWKQYYKVAECFGQRGFEYVAVKPSENKLKDVEKHQIYLEKMGLGWDLLYLERGVAVIKSGKLTVVVPENVIVAERFKDLDDIPIGELKQVAGSADRKEIVIQDDLSVNVMKNKMAEKENEIQARENEIAALEEEKRQELEKLRQELEAKYKEKYDMLEQKRTEMQRQMKALENQMFLLDTEIYSIRCFMGETIDFVPLASGKYSGESEPIVFFQKVRYIDEELGKYMAIYGYNGSEGDKALFEDVLKNREDIMDLFAPGPKSISLVKVSKNGVQLDSHPFISNVLTQYEVYHGQTIGILLRDGKNVWIGWTDEDKISLSDGNVFFKPETKEEAETNDAKTKSTEKEEIASRYFIFSILQGVLKRRIIRIPENVDIRKPGRYIVFSMADGWLEDNRYGSFADIIKRTNAPLKKGDMVLTTIRITRDDAYSSNSRYLPYNNNRGRGDANRTHDASISDCSVEQINCIDTIKTYIEYAKKYRMEVAKRITKEKKTNNQVSREFEYVTTDTNEFLEMDTNYILTYNDKFTDGTPTKGLTPEEVHSLFERRRYFNPQGIGDRYEHIDPFGDDHYYTIYDHTELLDEKKRYYISAEKSDRYSEGKKGSRANMEVMSNEYINMTYLNSIYLLYVLQNRNIGDWRIGGATVDFANALPYLNKALDYLRKREKKEAEMLEKYMDLYDEWQMDVSEWRLKNGYHRLTDARAKRFAKERLEKA